MLIYEMLIYDVSRPVAFHPY